MSATATVETETGLDARAALEDGEIILTQDVELETVVEAFVAVEES